MLGCGPDPWALQEIDLRGPGHRWRLRIRGKLAELVPGSARPALALGCGPDQPRGAQRPGEPGHCRRKRRSDRAPGPASFSQGQATLSSPGHYATPRGRPRVQAFGRPPRPIARWAGAAIGALRPSEVLGRASERATRLRLPPLPKRQVCRLSSLPLPAGLPA